MRFLQAHSSLGPWVAIITSIASMAIAIYSVAVATSQPNVVMVMPEWVRVAHNGNWGTIYVQPSFVSTGNNRVEVILDMELQVRHSSVQASGLQAFQWLDQGTWTYDERYQGVVYTYSNDPGPLLISPENPQLPHCRFASSQGWIFEPGTYSVTLVAQRAVVPEPLEGSFEVTLSEEDVQRLKENTGSYYTFPTRR